MRVGRRKQAGRARRSEWTGDRRGNMQVVEVMIVGLLVVAAVVAVSTMNVPVSETEGFKQDNERLAKDSLQAMLSRPSKDQKFGSLLEEHVMEAVSGNQKPLMEYLNKTLPGGAQYNVYLDNHHGPPFPLVEQGRAPRESVAGSIQFVPKLAYTFLVPEFARYHGDYHMNIYGVPIQSGVLAHDEGEPLELAMTVQQMDDNGLYVDDPVVLRTYSHTALRMNDPDERQWPSVGLWLEGDGDPPKRRYYFDASGMLPYQDKDPLDPLQTVDAYNISFTAMVEETANVKVPKNAEVTWDFPRGYDFNETKRNYIANSTGPDGLNNPDWWKDWTFEGHVYTGWTVTAKTKETFRDQAIPVHMSSNYRMILDTAYPFYTPITMAMGGGVQGQSTFLIDVPSAAVTGAYGREAYLSTTKPLISGDTSHWGIAFANDGAGTDLIAADKIEIQNITLRHTGGKALFTDVKHTSGWLNGTWKQAGAGEWYWDTDHDTVVAEATQVDLAFSLKGGSTQDNSFRNQDYMTVTTHFDPEYTHSVNTLGEWEFENRLWRMGEEWVYRDRVPPYDDVPGWPDQPGSSYWFTGDTTAYKRTMPGNGTFGVLPAAATANAFGGYQGAHVASELNIVDAKGKGEREFELGERVNIRNDFKALFGRLSQLDSAGAIAVSDLRVNTSVYTPEKAWKNDAQKTFSESASIAGDFGNVVFLRSTDLNGDGVPDLVVVGDGGIVYAIDGHDGAKLWLLQAGTAVSAAELIDLDGDGSQELLLGFNGGDLRAYSTKSGVSSGDRELWSRNLTPSSPWGVGTFKITDIVDTRSALAGEPDIVAGVSASSGQSRVTGLEATLAAATTVATYNGSALLPTDPGYLTDLEKVHWAPSGGAMPHIAVASENKTLTMLSYPDLAPVWIRSLPNEAVSLQASDLDGDGHEDLVVDTRGPSGSSSKGREVFTVSGASGEPGPAGRGTQFYASGEATREAIITEHGTLAVRAGPEFLEDTTGLYRDAETTMDATYTLDAAMGLHAVSNGTFYMVDVDGQVYHTWEFRPVAERYDWNETLPARSGVTVVDLFVEDTYPGVGRLYQLSDEGVLSYTTDTKPDVPAWTDLASICPGTGLPNTGIDCTGFSLYDWIFESDGNGTMESIWTVSNTNTKNAVHQFDVASGTWSELWASTGDFSARSLQMEADGTAWMGGLTVPDLEPAILERQPDGTERTHTMWLGDGGFIADLLVQDDGTGWAATSAGQVYHRTGDTLWSPYYTSDLFPGPVRFAEDPDGLVWGFGQNLGHFPLTTYNHTATADFGTYATGLDLAGQTASVTVTATEGHLGGDALSSPQKPALTAVTWYAKTPSGDAVRLEPQTTPYDGEIYTIDHTGTIDCLPDCSDVEVWAELENGFRRDGGSVAAMGGATPVIKDFTLNLTNAGSGFEKFVDVDAGALKGGSTAAHSTFHSGAILAEARTPWSFRGEATPGGSGLDRHVAVSSASLVDGSDGADVVVFQENTNGWQRWVIDGQTGAPEMPSDLESFGLGSNDRVDGILVSDMAGGSSDGIEDVVMFGSFASGTSAVRVWDIANDADHDSDQPSLGTVRRFADTGMADGRHTVAYADDDKGLYLLEASLQTSQPLVKWATSPAQDQGKVNFQYQIPMDAMYGTGVVVSELKFDVMEDGQQVTQTARLVDWFNIKPPGREVPQPPIYTVQLVSWFNES